MPACSWKEPFGASISCTVGYATCRSIRSSETTGKTRKPTEAAVELSDLSLEESHLSARVRSCHTPFLRNDQTWTCAPAQAAVCEPRILRALGSSSVLGGRG